MKKSSSMEKLESMAEPNLFEQKSGSKSEMSGDTVDEKHVQSLEQNTNTNVHAEPLPECSPIDFQLDLTLDNAPHKYESFHTDLSVYEDPSRIGVVGVADSTSFDLELVQLNRDFCGTSDSAIELRPEIKSEYTTKIKSVSSCEKTVESTEETTSLIKHLSTLFHPERSETEELLLSSDNIRRRSDFQGNNINMASAIYSENAVMKEDHLCYQGYTIRTEGADLCIHSVVFNAEGSKFRIVIKTTDYDQYYRGTISRIESEPRILMDDEKWTMLYGSFDDDSLGVVEIEVPPGVVVAHIKYDGPHQGFITIDVPQNTQPETRGLNSMDAVNQEFPNYD